MKKERFKASWRWPSLSKSTGGEFYVESEKTKSSERVEMSWVTVKKSYRSIEEKKLSSKIPKVTIYEFEVNKIRLSWIYFQHHY